MEIQAHKSTYTDHVIRCNNGYSLNPYHQNYENFEVFTEKKILCNLTDVERSQESYIPK